MTIRSTLGQERLRQQLVTLCRALAKASCSLSNEPGASAVGTELEAQGLSGAVMVEGGLGFRSGPKTSLHLDPLWLLISFPRGRDWGREPRISERGV